MMIVMKCRFNTEIPVFTVIDIESEHIWLMSEKDKIINELQEVLDHCNKTMSDGFGCDNIFMFICIKKVLLQNSKLYRKI